MVVTLVQEYNVGEKPTVIPLVVCWTGKREQKKKSGITLTADTFNIPTSYQ